MSLIGKKPIEITKGVEIELLGKTVKIKGPKGEVLVDLPPKVSVAKESDQLLVTVNSGATDAGAFWGLARSLLANAVRGVSEGYTKELEMVGVGYRVQKKGNGLELEVGYSHKIDFNAPEGIQLESEKNVIKVSGIDKQKVGQVAAEIRAVRKPEPYKGKGIRYLGEIVHLKPGKSAKAGA